MPDTLELNPQIIDISVDFSTEESSAILIVQPVVKLAPTMAARGRDHMARTYEQLLHRAERNLLEEALGMEQGYLLDLSDRTFNDFFFESWRSILKRSRACLADAGLQRQSDFDRSWSAHRRLPSLNCYVNCGVIACPFGHEQRHRARWSWRRATSLRSPGSREQVLR